MKKKYDANYVDADGNMKGNNLFKEFGKYVLASIATGLSLSWMLTKYGKMNQQVGYSNGYADAKDNYEAKSESEENTDEQ